MSRPIKEQTVVRSADGAIYIVSYVDGAYAELYDPERTGDRTRLPLAELTRIADPTNVKPKPTGMPDGPRPRCAFCQRHLKPDFIDETNGEHGWKRRYVRRTFRRWNAYLGLFCTTWCGIKFGAAAHQAGYRMRRAS